MKRLFSICGIALLVIPAITAQTILTKGTQVDLAFNQALSSKTAKVGDTVRLHVTNDVRLGGKNIIKRGTPVTGVLTKVDKRKRFGVNASMQITLNPVISTTGQKITLAPRMKGQPIGGTRGNMAAGAAAAGAVVLGPLGLSGGYFVVGKQVNIKPGDKLETEVTADTRIYWK